MKTIGTPRPLTREDMAIAIVPYHIDPTPKRLRETHHRIARLHAAGLRVFEIAQRTGYSENRVSVLLHSPAMNELIEQYRVDIHASFIREADDFHRTAFRNMQAAEDLISDRLDDAIDEGREIPLKDLIAISADRADRFGYPKQSNQLNANVNWADLLDKRLNAKRSERRDEVE